MIAAAALGALRGVRHGFFTREGGVSEGVYASLNCGLSTGDDDGRVAENRTRVCAALGVTAAALVTARQVHGGKAVTVTAPWGETPAAMADALATATPGVALGLLTADCAPVLLADADAGVVGAVHVGWRGALAGVTDAAVDAMDKLGAAPERTVAAIGPCIAWQSYEVGPEFPAPFLARGAGNARFFLDAEGAADGKLCFDLAGYLEARLRAAGVGLVETLGLDTLADGGRFFSYRRCVRDGTGDGGRQMSVIALG